MILGTDLDRIRGKKPAKEVLRGKMLLEPYFREAAPTAKVAIRDGMRIMTIGVNSVSGIAGLVSPGDYVDVIWSYRGGVEAQGSSSESTLTLFSQVLVYAVDDITTVGYRAERSDRSRGPSTPYNTVTLLLFPLECELLTFARTQGEVTLAKRSPTDGSAPPSPGVDSSHLDDLLKQARDSRGRGGK
jgi:pilus assembly protein CpaB